MSQIVVSGKALHPSRPRPNAPWIMIVLVGVVAATHIWKLPSALDRVNSELGIGLVQAGVLLGIIQVASMAGGLAVAWFGELFGLRRLLMIGLALLATGSLLGAVAPQVSWLMLSRALEGAGFLLCTVLAPALIRKCCTPERLNTAMAGWGAFQGTASFVGFFATAMLLQLIDWRILWTAMAVLTVLVIIPLGHLVPSDTPLRRPGAARSSAQRIWRTVGVLPPWIAGVVFACYTVQWMAVMGFLPTIYQESGITPLRAGLFSALVGGVNVIGAVSAGILLQRGRKPVPLLLLGFAVMALTSVGLFAVDWGQGALGIGGPLGAALMFSLIGGIVPTILSRVAVDLAPPGGSVAAVIGLMQQIFNVGNFLGPFIIAWIALQVDGWHASWWMMCGFSAIGMVLAVALGRRANLGKKEPTEI